jgi:hypothetical protein
VSQTTLGQGRAHPYLCGKQSDSPWRLRIGYICRRNVNFVSKKTSLYKGVYVEPSTRNAHAVDRHRVLVFNYFTIYFFPLRLFHFTYLQMPPRGNALAPLLTGHRSILGVRSSRFIPQVPRIQRITEHVTALDEPILVAQLLRSRFGIVAATQPTSHSALLRHDAFTPNLQTSFEGLTPIRS